MNITFNIAEGMSKAAPRLTLRKKEKLRHKTLVDALFSEGKSIYDFPLRLVWRAVSEQRLIDSFRNDIPNNMGELQMFVSIPKKKRRRAVDRVLLRRRIREAYRLNRLPLADVVNKKEDIRTLCMAFVFLGDQNTPYQEIEAKMKNLLQRLEKKLWKQPEDKNEEDTPSA